MNIRDAHKDTDGCRCSSRAAQLACLAVLLLCLLFGLTMEGAGVLAHGPNKYFKELRKISQKPRRFSGYYDMHGNAHESLQALMIGRFRFTSAICNELDVTPPSEFPEYAAALYHVLAEVKDPIGIPWFDERLQGSKKAEIIRHWLPRWKTYLRGAGSGEVKWLTEPDKWSEFFCRWWQRETNSANRVLILRAMQGWLHQPATLECFRRVEQSTRASGEEILIAQLYLQQHGASFSTNLLKATIERLSGIKGSQPLLLEYADEFRHEAFLPWLVNIVDDGRTEESGDAQWVLEAITFRRDIQGSAAWTKWAMLHIAEGRQVWKDRAITELEALAKTNSAAAKQFMDKAMYRWKDPILLQDMERLADHKSLHNEILGWII